MRSSPAHAYLFESSRTLPASGRTTSPPSSEIPRGCRPRRAGGRRFPSNERSTISSISGANTRNLEGEHKTKLHWGMESRVRQGSGAPAPLLFDLGAPKPTTRDIADLIRLGGGAGALTEATRRADAARYQEVRCRSALNPVKGMPFDWTLNPYRGCTHGCHYCFARRFHVQFELDSSDAFSSVILVKRNFVDVLRKELDRPSWQREYVAVGTATDVYQPIEGHYKLTRRSLVALAEARTPVGVITKGPM